MNKRQLKKQQSKQIQDKSMQHTKMTDGLVNVLNATAARRDTTSIFNNFYTAEMALDYAQLENIFMQNWAAKKIVTLPIEYMFKNGFTLKIDNAELEKPVMDLYKKHKLEFYIKRCLENRDIYGGGVILVKNFLQDPLAKFDYALAGVNAENIEFVERDLRHIAVQPYTHLLEANYFEPHRLSLAGLTTDASNCIIFKGVHVPLIRIASFRYMGMSVFQNIFQAMIMDDYVSKGIANMIWRNNRYYYKLNGLNELVSQNNANKALERLGMLEDGISILAAGVLDKEDEVEIVSQSFSSLADIDQRSIERLSAATNIPATVLLGKSPDGLNATGEGDANNFYDFIEAQQQRIVPQMEQLFKVLIAMASGGQLVNFTFEFNKPNQVNPSKQTELESKVLDNVIKMQQLGLPDDIIKHHLISKGLITQEQSETFDLINLEMQKIEAEAENQETDEDLSTNEEL